MYHRRGCPSLPERKRAGDEIRLLNADLEQRVHERTARLEAANRELEAFTYTVSHDLRAPLRIAEGFSRILAEEYAAGLDDDGRHVCDGIRQNILRMSQLIDDLLRFSRLSQAELRCEPIDMRAMATAVFGELAAQQPARRIGFTVDELPTVVGDPSMIRQVWVNLLSNAVKYTALREEAAIAVSHHRAGDGECAFVVRDNGAGFDMEQSGRLFGVFQRLENARGYEGTGVGLAIVKRVVERHGRRGRPGRRGLLQPAHRPHDSGHRGSGLCRNLGSERVYSARR